MFDWKSMIINLTIFILTFLGFFYLFTILGWKPENQLSKEKRQLSTLEIVVLVVTAVILSAYLCFLCGPIRDGIMTGLLYAVILKLFYQYKTTQS
jgi:archaellum biogenesis protein FlaJ (TadC family)